MSDQMRPARPLVPRLRFPDFLEEWATGPVSGLYHFKGNNSLSRDKLNYDQGCFRNIHYGDIHTKYPLHLDANKVPIPYVNDDESQPSIRPENYCMAGDIVFADASEDMDDIGKAIEIVDVGDLPLVAGLHTILARPKDRTFVLGFGAYLFSSRAVRKQIQRESQGAKVLGISAGRLGNVQLYYPQKSEEQQKIADCLSSLDAVIQAEQARLEALKTHKKGLMQQLFPRDGETVPRLRFPEFRNAGEWGECSLFEMLQEALRPVEMDDQEKYRLLTVRRRYGGVVPRGSLYGAEIKVKSQFFVKADDFLISKRQIVHCACGVVPNEHENAIVSNEYTVLTTREPCHIGFFGYFAQQQSVSRSFIECSVGIVIEKMLFNSDQWLKRRFLFPGIDEQKRIFEVLSSIDALILHQETQIINLLNHRAALMQQLFPYIHKAST